MSVVYLNGEFMPLEEARISPLDRGFLFGDGIYEVVPSYAGKQVGGRLHFERMEQGLADIGIDSPFTYEQWQSLCEQLCERNEQDNLAIYVHVSRGADNRRHHAFPKGVSQTVFAMTYPIECPAEPDRVTRKGSAMVSCEDLRWRRCNIKSTALLGNVLHYQYGNEAACDEVLLFNQDHQITEASAANVFVIKQGVVITPPLDNQILPGITRHLILDILRKDGSIVVEERPISLQEAQNADEIWISSSSKEISPVVTLDGKPVGTGKVGEVWQRAATLYAANKFNYS